MTSLPGFEGYVACSAATAGPICPDPSATGRTCGLAPPQGTERAPWGWALCSRSISVHCFVCMGLPPVLSRHPHWDQETWQDSQAVSHGVQLQGRRHRVSRGPGFMVFAQDKEKGDCAVTLQHRFSVYFSGSSLGAGISFPPLRQDPL